MPKVLLMRIGYDLRLSGSFPPVEVNTAYSKVLQASGGRSPYTITHPGTDELPSTFLDNGDGTASYEFPGAPSSGTYSLTFQVKDADRRKTLRTFDLVVFALPLVFDATAVPEAEQNELYSLALPFTGGNSPYSITSYTGLPEGVTASLDGLSVLLSGTPTSSPATYDFSVTISDSEGRSATFEGAMEVVLNVVSMLHFTAADGTYDVIDDFPDKLWVYQTTRTIEEISNNTFDCKGNSAWIRCDSAFSPIDEPWTLEFFIRTPDYYGGGDMMHTLSHNLYSSLGQGYVDLIIYQSTARVYFTVDGNQWVHIALCRDGGDITVWGGGTLAYLQNPAAAPSAAINYVEFGGATKFIDEIRFTRYVRYTAPFTPPSRPFPVYTP